MAMEHQFIVPGSASLLKGRQGVIYEELGGLERQYRWKLGAMVELGTGAGGSIATDTLFDAAGDLVVGSGADTAARLAIGSDGQVLTSNGTTVAWANPAAGHLGTVASEAAMSALSTAIAGSTCLRSDIGTGGTYYELFQVPYSSAANWQPLSGAYSNSAATLQLTPGKAHTLYVDVPAASTGDRVQITVGGVPLQVLLPSAQTHVIPLGDPPGIAAPTTVVIQRTTGSGGVGNYSLDNGPAYSLFSGAVITYAALLAAFPEKSGSMPPDGTVVPLADMRVDVVSDGVFWTPTRTPQAPKWVDATQNKWIGPANTAAMSTSAGQSRSVFRAAFYRMSGDRPGSIDALSMATLGAGVVGAGTDEFDFRVYPCQPDGTVLVGTVPYVIKFNAAGSGGAGQTVWDSLGTNVTGCLANVGAGVKELHGVFPSGALTVPWGFYAGIFHNMGTSPTLSSISTSGLLFSAGPTFLNAGGWPDETSSTPNRMTGYSWAESWVAGGTATPWPAGAAFTQQAVYTPRLRVVS